MQYLNYFYKKNLKYDLINKFYYNKTKNLPELNKIILHLNCKNSVMKNLASSLLAFKLIISQKGKLTISKKGNILLKIKKGSPVGCTTILKNQVMLNFLKRFKNGLLKKTKNFNTICSSKNKTSFSIEIMNTFNNFNELKTNFYFFNELKNLEIIFIIHTKLNCEVVFILKSYKLLLIK